MLDRKLGALLFKKPCREFIFLEQTISCEFPSLTIKLVYGDLFGVELCL